MSRTLEPCYKCNGGGSINILLPVELDMSPGAGELPKGFSPVSETVTCPACHGSGKWTYPFRVTTTIDERAIRLGDGDAEAGDRERNHLRQQHREQLSAQLGEKIRGNPKFQEETFGMKIGDPYEFPVAVLAEETIETETEIRTTFTMGVVKA